MVLSRPQVQPDHTRNGLKRLGGFGLRPVGYWASDNDLVTPPSSFFLAGAPDSDTRAERLDSTVFPLATDVI